VVFFRGIPKLADIGLVAGVDESLSFVGTDGYVPPEGPSRPSADCYALGKLLYELSTGHDRNAWPEPAPNLATRPDRKQLLELNAIIHRACAPAAADRYVSAGAMVMDFEMLGQVDPLKKCTGGKDIGPEARSSQLPLRLSWWPLA
jgi:serine/threonine protein kinase